MKQEDKLLFICTRQNFLDTHKKTILDLCNREKINWEIVYDTAKLHSVAPLIYLNLQKCSENGLTIPSDIVKKFKLYTYTRIALENKRAETLKNALAFFHQRSVDVMLIKGIALNALVYKHPWIVNKNDFDIIIKPRTSTLTVKEKNEINDYIENIKLKGIECDYFTHHDIHYKKTLVIDFADIWSNAKKIKFLGYNVYVMAPEDMLIVACINCQRKRYFRLKTLFDIIEIINTYSDLNWEVFTNKAKKSRCNNIIYTTFFVAKKTIGCNFPGTVFKDLSVFPLRKLIIHLVIRYLNLRMSLTSIYPFSEENPLLRKTNLSLILPLAVLDWQQLWLKILHNQKKFDNKI